MNNSKYNEIKSNFQSHTERYPNQKKSTLSVWMNVRLIDFDLYDPGSSTESVHSITCCMSWRHTCATWQVNLSNNAWGQAVLLYKFNNASFFFFYRNDSSWKMKWGDKFRRIWHQSRCVTLRHNLFPVVGNFAQLFFISKWQSLRP